MNYAFESAITREIDKLEAELDEQMAGLVIGTRIVARLSELRLARAKELAAKHQEILSDRRERAKIMKIKIRQITDATIGKHLDLKPDLAERIFVEMEKYYVAANVWVYDESFSPWETSEASHIAATILIFINEIH